MFKKYLPYFVCFALGIALGLTINNSSPEPKVYENSEMSSIKTEQSQRKSKTNSNENTVPKKVYEVLDYVVKNNKAPNGYVGGRRFKNLEGHLPNTDQGKKINYREWDVNSKKEGKNRGRERLVTGDNKTAYFTMDHYNSFIKIE